MKKLTKVLSLVLMATLLLSLAACGGATSSGSGTAAASTGSGGAAAATGNTITIRYGTADAEDTAIVQGVFAFKEYVEEASGGSIKVETYINGTLGGDRELCESLQMGSVDMTAVLGGVLANYDGGLNVLALPYLFESKQATYDALDGAFGDKIKEMIEGIKFVPLGFGDMGTYQVANNGKPVQTVDDIRGLKIRVPEAEVDIAFFTALGATPTPVSFSETYTALEQGVVNGLELPVELMYCSKMMEPVEYLTMTGHMEGIAPILMSNITWGKLSDEQKQIVRDGVAVQMERNRQMAVDVEEKYIQEFKDMGGTVYELSAEEKQGFMDVGDQVQQTYVDKVGQDLIDLAKSFN